MRINSINSRKNNFIFNLTSKIPIFPVETRFVSLSIPPSKGVGGCVYFKSQLSLSHSHFLHHSYTNSNLQTKIITSSHHHIIKSTHHLINQFTHLHFRFVHSFFHFTLSHFQFILLHFQFTHLLFHFIHSFFYFILLSFNFIHTSFYFVHSQYLLLHCCFISTTTQNMLSHTIIIKYKCSNIKWHFSFN